MVFTYAYRDAHGAMCTDSCEAVSRADVFAQLKEQGIHPISVKEGGSLRSGVEAKVPGGRASRARRVAAIAACIVVTASLTAWLLSDRKEKAPAATPGRAAAAPSRPASAANANKPKTRPALKVPVITTQRIEKRAEIPMPKKLEEVVVETEKAVAPEEMPKKEKPRRIFRRGVEQLLALATPATPGAPVPPLPQITDESVAEDLKAAMQEAIRPTTNDTERTLEMKLTVSEQKEEFRDLRKDGMTFTEYLNALRDKFNQEHEFLAAAHRMNDALYHDATITDEEYKAYRAELNEKLKERGLPELE